MRAIVLKALIVAVMVMASTAFAQNVAVGSAFVKGDGYARPNYVEVTFVDYDGTGDFNTTPETWRKPDSVSLRWPGICDGASSVTVTSRNIMILPDGVTIGVTFPTSAFPEGYSFTPPSNWNNSEALVTIHGAIDEGSVFNPTALVDSIGPLIARPRTPYCGAEFINPTFDENKTPGVTPYTLRLQITEDLVNLRSLLGNSLLISSDSLGTGERPLNVDEILVEGGKITLTLSSDSRLYDGYWIKLNPAHPGITDMDGNAPHLNNRRVQIFEQEVPADITDTWYTTNDATGKAEYLYIVFDKNLPADGISSWFVGGSFTFNWGNVVRSAAPFNITPENIGSITLLEGTQNTIRIDLNAVFPEAVAAYAQIMTVGSMSVEVAFSPNKSGWPSRAYLARDRARPVLISAMLQIGRLNDLGNYTPDTLVLTFSERLNDNMIRDIANPISIASKQNADVWTPVTVRTPAASFSIDGAYYVVRYLVEDIRTSDGKPQLGDYIKINGNAGVSDYVQNVQDNPNNRRVQLGVNGVISVLTPARVVPQPKPPEEAIVIAPISQLTGEFTVGPNPVSKESGIVKFYRQGKRVATCELRIYDATGNVINKVKIKDNAIGNQSKRKVGMWDLCDRNGRMVPVGTYLVRGMVKTSDGKREKVSLIIGIR